MNYVTRYDLPDYMKSHKNNELGIWERVRTNSVEGILDSQVKAIKDSARLLTSKFNNPQMKFDNHQDSGTTWTDGTNTYKTSNGQILKSVSGDYEHAGKDVSYKSPFKVVL